MLGNVEVFWSILKDIQYIFNAKVPKVFVMPIIWFYILSPSLVIKNSFGQYLSCGLLSMTVPDPNIMCKAVFKKKKKMLPVLCFDAMLADQVKDV